MKAAPLLADGTRVIAIAKERLGTEEFVKDHWNAAGGMRNNWLIEKNKTEEGETKTTTLNQPPAFENPELFYDTVKNSELPGANPLFRLANGSSMKWSGVFSYLTGGAVAKSNKRVDSKNIKGDMEGEGTILGSVLVIDKDGQVLLHHKEQSWGDHPSDEDLFAAITKLGGTSPSSSSL